MEEDNFTSFLNSPSQQQAFPYFPDSIQAVEPSFNSHSGGYPATLNVYGESGRNPEWKATNEPLPALRVGEAAPTGRAGAPYSKDFPGQRGVSKNTPILKKFEAAASRV